MSVRGRARATVAALVCGLALGTLAQGCASDSTAAAPLDPAFPTLGDTGYRVGHYTIDIRYGLGDHRLVGDTTVRARATSRLTSFDLDLRLPVRSVAVDGTPATFRTRAGKVSVTPAHPVAAGATFATRVRYAGRPADVRYPEAGYGWATTTDGALVAGEPWAASSWFPSNDHPSQKAPFDIYVTTSSRKQVVSNGRLVGRRAVPGHRTRWHWRMNRPMATYLAYVEIGDFTFERGRSRGGVPYLYAIDKHLGPIRHDAVASLRRTPRIVDYYSRTFGRYPFATTGGTLANATFPFSLENQSRPQYSKVFFGQGVNDDVIAHELAHMWFGDAVSLAHWRDIWINEGFATWSSWLWEDHTGQTPMAASFARAWDDERQRDFWSVMIATPSPGQVFSTAVYNRGAMTLAALRRVIGDHDFFELLRTWVREHRYGNASSADFEKLAAEISGKDLTGFFDTWLRTPGKPAATAANGVPPGLA